MVRSTQLLVLYRACPSGHLRHVAIAWWGMFHVEGGQSAFRTAHCARQHKVIGIPVTASGPVLQSQRFLCSVEFACVSASGMLTTRSGKCSPRLASFASSLERMQLRGGGPTKRWSRASPSRDMCSSWPESGQLHSASVRRTRDQREHCTHKCSCTLREMGTVRTRAAVACTYRCTSGAGTHMIDSTLGTKRHARILAAALHSGWVIGPPSIQMGELVASTCDHSERKTKVTISLGVKAGH